MRFKDFTFEDPTRKFKGEPATLFEGKLDAKGQARFSATIESGGEAPAMLEADFTTRVFEEGGAFSTAHSSEPFHPYQRYVGLRLPKGDAIRGMLLTDQKHTVELAVLDAEGKGVSADAIHVSVHKIEWKWWWEKDGATTNADFASGQNLALVAEGDVPVKDGRGSWPFEIKYPDWGRYLVRACDPEGGHCTGRIFYADWPGWAGRAEEQTGPGANALYFFADKPEYRVGHHGGRCRGNRAAATGEGHVTHHVGLEGYHDGDVVAAHGILARGNPRGRLDDPPVVRRAMVRQQRILIHGRNARRQRRDAAHSTVAKSCCAAASAPTRASTSLPSLYT